jgi:ABC-type branched-subunit amino acid transport system ATPase component
MATLLEMREGYVQYVKTAIVHIEYLHVESGEVVLLNGANGSGKTSLFKAIMGTETLFTGRLYLLGRSTGQEIGTAERLSYGVVFGPQGRHVFPRLSVPQHRELTVRWLHGEAGRPDSRREELYQREARTLSGGEAKLMIIESLMTREHKLLLMDEPLASLDSEKIEYVLSLVRRRITAGVGCLVSDHTGLIASEFTSRSVYIVQKEQESGVWLNHVETIHRHPNHLSFVR